MTSTSKGAPKGQATDAQKCLDLFFPGSDAPLVGPLSVLAKALRLQEKVLVVTRHKTGIRGVCSGRVAAFDKHFNLLLRDVDERYSVLHKTDPPSSSSSGGGDGGDLSGHRQRHPNDERRWKKKLEYYRRHIPQVLIRGEGIVLVSLNGGDGKDYLGSKHFSS